ncbi:ThuA domain-containing protein [Asticcacaulis sp. ZE23SCel15]|uniref:ThuA domain-containing protein n=1 Tax=Asticcacaulis sp. ZE23SCel15 TaxID=3059027 RepID=UPI00265E94E6|nr:ThuA domain-containing protein [Asticcacaulis sp. ZE23SCel15]WKL57738.1 ThuA domain-containing protein [Asticcacaulis sp. ZE23SCel15]
MQRRAIISGMAAAIMVPKAVWADTQFKVLVIGMPSKYHYEYVPVARESLERMAKLHAFEMVWSHNAYGLDQDLKPYAAIMLLNTPTEDLSADHRAKFEAYVRAGGHVMVVHRAAIALPADSWPWYEKLVGRTVGVHPMLQTGVVTVVDKSFPATFGLPPRWIWSDEFYTTTNPHNVKITPVLNVDETSYDPTKIWPGQVVKGMGKDHPIAWYHSYEGSRVFVTTLGHNVEMYRDPQYLSHLLGGLYWTATGLGRG